MAVSDVRVILLASNDDVAATLEEIEPTRIVTVALNASGETVQELTVRQRIPFGHKVAVRDIPQGKQVHRYGFPIGIATTEIKAGEHVHSHNMRSMLSSASRPSTTATEMRPAEWVRQLVNRSLQAAGAHPEAADAMANVVTEAHLRGVETHGLRRLRPYVARIRSGGVDGRARFEVSRHQTLLKIDGRNAIGHYVASGAARAVSDAARQYGIAIALVRASNHFGFAGYYATLIAEQGQLGVVTSNGQVCVAPEGATRPLFSNNPLAIAAPTGRKDAFLEMDLAMSLTSRAHVIDAARSGICLPQGWAQDADGNPTCNPTAALSGSLLAFGGRKGFALLVALEALTGVLSGGAYADQVSSKEATPDAPEGTGHTMIAIDLQKVMGVDLYSQRLDDLFERLARLPTSAQTEPTRYPGERRWKLRRQRLREGIPIEAGQLKDVLDLANELGVRTL
jgi:LDH2 family malate/lactate/ureidoglycolate dehydrogenase